MSTFPAPALDLPRSEPSGGTQASQRTRKRLTMPSLTQESHFCRNGQYETILTPWGEAVIVFGMLLLALGAVYVGWQWRELSDWAAVTL